jgi:predicted component of type VI protein secretion system
MLIGSFRQAAAVTGLTPSTVREWVTTGELSPPPWTVEELATVRDRHARHQRVRGTAADHGTNRRFDAGCSCALCRNAHRQAVTRAEHAAANRRFPPAARDRLLRLIVAGMLFGPAVRQLGLTPGVVWGRCQWDPDWATHLTAALDAVRPAGLPHGRQRAYRAGCRCTDCRRAATPGGLPSAGGAG